MPQISSRGYEIREESSNNISQGFPHPFPVKTKFDSVYEHRKFILEHMAGAFRVFARKGYAEGAAGHISVRDPGDPNTFWINPLNIHFGQLRAQDMVRVDEEGNVVGGNKVAVNAAGFRIHSALHKSRPDVNAACHTHSIYGRTWSTFGKPLEMLNQDACAFYDRQAVYTEFGGVVLEGEEGEKLAKSLGEKNSVIILQNHGLLTTGQTVDEAAYKFTLMEGLCQTQLMVNSNVVDNKKVIDPDAALYTRTMIHDSASHYADFQSDYEYEKYLTKGEFLFPEDYALEKIE